VIKIAVMVATGVNADGYREILGVATSTSESGAGWSSNFGGPGRPRPDRGRAGTSDAHTGLVDAIGANLPGAAWQRRTHYTVNLMAVCPKPAWGGVKAMLHSVFEQVDAQAVHAQYDKLLDHVRGLPRSTTTSTPHVRRSWPSPRSRPPSGARFTTRSWSGCAWA